jgi:hypothetical protein
MGRRVAAVIATALTQLFLVVAGTGVVDVVSHTLCRRMPLATRGRIEAKAVGSTLEPATVVDTGEVRGVDTRTRCSARKRSAVARLRRCDDPVATGTDHCCWAVAPLA